MARSPSFGHLKSLSKSIISWIPDDDAANDILAGKFKFINENNLFLTMARSLSFHMMMWLKILLQEIQNNFLKQPYPLKMWCAYTSIFP